MPLSPSTTPPIAKKQSVELVHKDHSRMDSYAWMRAENWQEVMRDPSTLAPDIREHLEAENAYTKTMMADWQPLIDTLHQEMIGRLKEDDQSPPSPHGLYSYTSRFVIGAQHRQYLRYRKDKPDQEELLFDADAASKASDFYNLGGIGISPDHRLLAVAEDTSGAEVYAIRFWDTKTQVWLDEVIPNTSGDFSWLGTNGGLIYTTLDESHRSSKVWRRLFGQPDDALIYEEQDGAWQVGVSKTSSGRYHILSRGTSGSNACFVMDAYDEAASPRLVAEPEPDVYYSLEDQGQRFFILTNADGATDFKICTAPLDFPSRDTWTDWLAHKPGCLIEEIDLFTGHLVRTEKELALPRIVITDLATGDEHSIEQSESAYELSHAGSREFDTSLSRYVYASPTTPTQIYDYDLITRERRLVYEQIVPSGHVPDDYQVERIFATAHDGAKIPVTILSKAGMPRDGSAPLFVYGYGSYGISQSAGFVTTRLSLVDRGFIFAIAHIRGGMDLGYGWYLDGKLDKKANTFKDFISVTEQLCDQGYGTRGQVASMGGSAGGLLMGAVINMRPDLFKAIVASVPFVDVLSTILDDSLPLTPGEWTEWGNPIDNANAYQTILSYSPYDQVKAQDYPSLFVTAGISDPRVTYWEPAKWVAKLRDIKTDSNSLLFKTNMTAGHFGVSGRFDRLIEVAEEYAFVLKTFGLADD